MRLLGKVAVVTGGARGLGAAMCELFAKEGAKCIAVDMGDATFENENIELYKLNITDVAACQAFYDYAVEKYGKIDNFAFAVGDGNHSLATAKTHWNNVKKNLTEEEKENHPARFALCEIVNVYDEGIYFEPIHRYVFGVDKKAFINGLENINGGKICVYDGKEKIYNKNNTLPGGITAVDNYIKEYISRFGGGVDYVHGDNNLKKLVDDNGSAVGIMFEKLDKKQLFPFVSSKGAFPRKTFSMGEGIEKRYYLEGKKIK